MRSFLGVLLMLALPLGARAQTNFTVVNNGTTAYKVDGVNNPTLNLLRGNTYNFNVTATGHPFYIKTARTTGTGDQFTSGVTGQGVTSGTCTFVVPSNAPATLFYQCSVHSAMGGTLSITTQVDVPPDGVPQLAWLGPAVPNPSTVGATFRFGLPTGAHVDFSVFDARGRSIQVLTRGVLPPGVHLAIWNGRDRTGTLAPAGVYFYRLKIGNEVLGGRLVVAR
jgi:hypothetical protein